VNTQLHEDLKGTIWEIANRLRGPYRPPQYRLVMLPLVVLRRLDCVLEPTKDKVLKEYEKLQAKGTPEEAMMRLLSRAADPKRKQPLYNVSPFTFDKLIADSENIAPNLVAYINGFSATARRIFEKFGFAEQIEKLDASNRLFTLIKAMAAVNLHPDRIDNMQMGYLFEHLIMRFNEQANEEAGDHFTPREVIRLMASLVYTGESEVYTPGIYRSIYDPACGTGGMLSESEKFILGQNGSANLALFGQDYNAESWAICCSDMLIKDEDIGNIVLGDTLGDGKTHDGFEGKQFHYLLANPPFGVEWKDQKTAVENEAKTLGFNGRFGAGTPAINDGSLLFLQHMIAKMHASPAQGGEGSKIAIVFNGSPLFSGDAGSGPSNIRRWIIEHRHLHLHLAGHQPQARGTPRQGAADRRHALFPAHEEKSQQQAQRDQRRADCAVDASVRSVRRWRNRRGAYRRQTGDPCGLAHLRQPRVRFSEGHRGTPLADELRGHARAHRATG
jgi:type I restriction enzyme M protein